MFDWFIKTFDSAQQQATLFSIVVSTILAISLLLMNQWFTSRKAKADLKVLKLEELMNTLYAYERLCFDVIAQSCNKKAAEESVFHKMTESVELADKIEMLTTLYFPSIEYKSEDTQYLLSKIHVNCLLHANAEEKWSEEDRISLFNQDTSDIKSLISVIKNSAKIEMKKYT
ncbi:hypothetical protein [Vibrio parahaemolyticus]|uniref:hypothetical protein n=1 Tax=Vibrio parahaemolyticus TaxID=670 RepID=UPI00111CBCEF|nr:hypothetical protein [Vibrio parahaemolyticus]TOQ63563.1 hypothetical protein CGG90_24275 [Vibrio parahaemolyticus]